jgi:hypothetical protein
MKFTAALFILLSLGTASASNLAELCDFEALPTTQKVTKIFTASNSAIDDHSTRDDCSRIIARADAKIKCGSAGYSSCELIKYESSMFLAIDTCRATVSGSKTIPLSKSELKKQACIAATECHDASVRSNREDADQFLNRAERMINNYKCN